MMDLFMKYYIMTSLQEGRRLDFTDETLLHYEMCIRDRTYSKEEVNKVQAAKRPCQ